MPAWVRLRFLVTRTKCKLPSFMVTLFVSSSTFTPLWSQWIVALDGSKTPHSRSAGEFFSATTSEGCLIITGGRPVIKRWELYTWVQHAEKVGSNSPGLFKGYWILFLRCLIGKQSFLGNSNYKRTVINLACSSKFFQGILKCLFCW